MARTHMHMAVHALLAFWTWACAEHRGSVRMASNSKNKPPTTSSDGHESRRWREGAAAPRDAEIAPPPHLVEVLLEVSEYKSHVLDLLLEVRRAPLLSRCSFRLAQPLQFFRADFRPRGRLDLLPDLRSCTPSRRVDGVDRSRLLHWKRTVRRNAIRRFLTLTQSLTNLWA